MLGVIEEAEFMFGGGVAEVVPVAEGGGGETSENHIPKIVGWNFTRIFATFEAEAETEGLGALAQAEKNFLHARPTFLKGFFPSLDGGNFLTDISTRSDLTGGGEGFERFGQIAWSGGSKMEHDEAGSDGRGGFESGDGVAFGQATAGGAGIGKFVGVGVGSEEFDRNGAEVVQDIDLGGVGESMFGQDARPEAKAGVVA